MTRSSDDLPDPVRPTTSASSPSGMERVTSSQPGLAASGYVTSVLETDHAATCTGEWSGSRSRCVERPGIGFGTGGATHAGQCGDHDADHRDELPATARPEPRWLEA